MFVALHFTLMLSDTTPGSIFNHLFPDHLLETVVHQTNLCASTGDGNANYANWEKLTVTELRANFGFNFLMGLVHLPAIEDYW